MQPFWKAYFFLDALFILCLQLCKIYASINLVVKKCVPCILWSHRIRIWLIKVTKDFESFCSWVFILMVWHWRVPWNILSFNYVSSYAAPIVKYSHHKISISSKVRSHNRDSWKWLWAGILRPFVTTYHLSDLTCTALASGWSLSEPKGFVFRTAGHVEWGTAKGWAL